MAKLIFSDERLLPGWVAPAFGVRAASHRAADLLGGESIETGGA
jgi:hypothetical protein